MLDLSDASRSLNAPRRSRRRWYRELFAFFRRSSTSRTVSSSRSSSRSDGTGVEAVEPPPKFVRGILSLENGLGRGECAGKLVVLGGRGGGVSLRSRRRITELRVDERSKSTSIRAASSSSAARRHGCWGISGTEGAADNGREGWGGALSRVQLRTVPRVSEKKEPGGVKLRSEVVITTELCESPTPHVVETCKVGIKDLDRIRRFSSASRHRKKFE